MEWTQIITIIITSSVISSIITVISQHLLAKYNYKREYYSKILDKRMEVYDDLHFYLTRLTQTVKDDDNNKWNYKFDNGKKEIEEFMILQSAIMMKSNWLSNSLEIKMRFLNELYLRIFEDLDKIDDNDNDGVVKIGIKYYKEIYDIRIEIFSILNADLLSLHDIRKFLKEKK